MVLVLPVLLIAQLVKAVLADDAVMVTICQAEHAQHVHLNVKHAMILHLVNYVLLVMLNKFYQWTQLEFKMLSLETPALLAVVTVEHVRYTQIYVYRVQMVLDYSVRDVQDCILLTTNIN